MSEKNKEHDSGVAPSTIGVDPAAMALALGGASREDAGAFLKKQSALIDDQQHHLHEQFKHLRLLSSPAGGWGWASLGMGLAGLIGRQTDIFLSRGGMGVKPVKPTPTLCGFEAQNL